MNQAEHQALRKALQKVGHGTDKQLRRSKEQGQIRTMNSGSCSHERQSPRENYCGQYGFLAPVVDDGGDINGLLVADVGSSIGD